MSKNHTLDPLPHHPNDTIPELVLTHLTSWAAITVCGDDRKSYLNGQITPDVVSLETHQSTFGAHCDPKGKVWSVFRLFHHHDSYAMIQPSSVIEAELRELKKYAVFSKVEIESSKDTVLGITGHKAQNYIDQFSNSQGDVRSIDGGTAIKITDHRWMILVTKARAETLISEFKGTTTDESFWKRFDIEDAFPFIYSASEQCQHIPQALNLQSLGGICFTKGCYTGQETIARAKYRGINKRAMLIMKGNLTEPLDQEKPAEIERAVGENWRIAGHLLTSYTFSDLQTIGLIILPKDLAEDTRFRLKSQPETEWSIQPLPYSIADDE